MKSLRSKYTANLVCGICFLVLAIAVALYTGTIHVGTLNFGAMNSRSFPYICSAIIATLSTILIVQSILGLRKAPPPTEAEKKFEREDRKRLLHVACALGLIFLYVELMKPLGYLIVTPLFLFFLILLVTPKSVRNLTKTVVVSIVTSIIIYGVFRYGFSVQLPLGLLKNVL